MREKKPVYQQALDGLKRREGLFRILIFSFITVLIWIGFSVYRANIKTKVSIDTQKHTEPLNPNINSLVFDELATRIKYSDEELESFTVYERIVDENGVSQLVTAGSVVDFASTTPSNSVSEEVSVDEEILESEDVATSSAILLSEDETASASASPSATPN